LTVTCDNSLFVTSLDLTQRSRFIPAKRLMRDLSTEQTPWALRPKSRSLTKWW